jgi:hypothetical protein
VPTASIGSRKHFRLAAYEPRRRAGDRARRRPSPWVMPSLLPSQPSQKGRSHRSTHPLPRSAPRSAVSAAVRHAGRAAVQPSVRQVPAAAAHSALLLQPSVVACKCCDEQSERRAADRESERQAHRSVREVRLIFRPEPEMFVERACSRRTLARTPRDAVHRARQVAASATAHKGLQVGQGWSCEAHGGGFRPTCRTRPTGRRCRPARWRSVDDAGRVPVAESGSGGPK